MKFYFKLNNDGNYTKKYLFFVQRTSSSETGYSLTLGELSTVGEMRSIKNKSNFPVFLVAKPFVVDSLAIHGRQ